LTQVTRCVCFSVHFEDLKEIAEKHDCRTIEELQRHVEFGMGCRMCLPYVAKMLLTGQTDFHWKEHTPKLGGCREHD